MFDVKLELYFENQKITAYQQDVIESCRCTGFTSTGVLPAAKVVASVN